MPVVSFQQILAIPFYFNVINNLYIDMQKSQYGDNLLYIKELQLIDNEYYIRNPDKSLEPIDYSHITYKNDMLYRMLITAKLFEETDGNPINIFKLYKIYIPDKSGIDRRLGTSSSSSFSMFTGRGEIISEYTSYIDISFYQTLMNQKIMDRIIDIENTFDDLIEKKPEFCKSTEIKIN